MSVQVDSSVVNIIEPGQQIDQSSLTCSGSPCNCYPGACRYAAIYIIQYLLTGQITESNILEAYSAFGPGKLQGTGHVLRFCLLIQNLKYAFCSGHCGLEVVVDVGYVHKGP